MKKYVVIILLLVIVAVALVESFLHFRHKRNWILDNYTKKDVYITMRDGVRLYTIIYIPKDNSTRHPILINRTPYSVESYGENSIRTFSYWNSLYADYFRENYIMVRQDVRGRYMSEGTFMDVRPFNPNKKGKETDEASDAYDTIDWLVKNINNNNGKVGVFGISYPGFYTNMAAYCGHPALKAVSPQAPIGDWFIGDDWHHNGAFMELGAFNFYRFFGEPRHDTQRSLKNDFHYYTKDSYRFFLNAGPLKNLAKYTGDSLPFFKQIYEHPNYDSFWEVRTPLRYAQYIHDSTASLIVGGFFDAEDLYGELALYDSIEKKAKNNNRLVMGPWMHGGWAFNKGDYLGNIRFGAGTSEWYQKNIELPFFNYYLQGKGNIDHIKEANIFFTGINKWKTFDQWPPKQMEHKPLYLHNDGTLSWAVSTVDDAYNKYTSDPSKPVPYTPNVTFKLATEYMDDDQRFAVSRPDVLVYETDSLEEEITLAGPVVADIFTAISTTDADFVVKLIDVFPDNFSYSDSIDGKGSGTEYIMGGYQMLVRAEVMRGRYRNSYKDPQPFNPSAITEVRYTLPDVAHVFKKRHRLMIQIQSSWFPLIDRNPQQFVDIYHCEQKDFVPCDIKIYSGRIYPSNIILPVVY